MQQYAYSIRKFFVWLQEAVPQLADKPMSDISCEDLDLLTARDIEEFMISLQVGKTKNSRSGVAQKIAAIGSLFKYLYRHNDISSDPFAKIERPKLVQDKRIIYLTDDECVLLLNAIQALSQVKRLHTPSREG